MRRRDFLRKSALLSVGNLSLIPTTLASQTPLELKPRSVSYIAAAKSRLGEASFVCLNSQGELLKQHDIPSRGHSFARSRHGHTAAIARRPADFCLILNKDGDKVAEFNAVHSRHFYGHGVYDDAGDYLYLTENDYGYQGSRGVVGVYSAADGYARIAEFESGGIGPHQIILSNDGSELLVANGGIQTHPESGRKKLNLQTMKPSLVFIDRKTGVLRKSFKLEAPYSTNSIRHMAQHSSGHVYLALQQQEKAEETCLLAVFDPDEIALSKLPLLAEYEEVLSGYVGDIALDASEQYLGITSPYGNVVLIMDLRSGDVFSLALDDVCGLSGSINGGLFVVTTGRGLMIELSLSGDRVAQSFLTNNSQQVAWDNHLLSFI